MELSQEEYNELIKNQRIVKLQLMGIQDTLDGGIRSANIKEFRNTYVINAQDSLDATYPMYVHFNIIDEMVKVVSVKVDFWILNYRAYSKAGVATGTPSGGGSTTESGGGSTSGSGGGQTSSVESGTGSLNVCGAPDPTYNSVTNVGDENESGVLLSNFQSVTLPSQDHTHTVSNHTHTTPNHTHDTPDHTHPDHTHTAVYGIFEEDTSPTIKFYVSETAGVTYSSVFGGYTTDKSALDITSLITTKGSKLIKFESDLRARLSIQVTIKLDIKAR